MPELDCPLCANQKPQPFAQVAFGQTIRDYYICLQCDLVWLHPDQQPDAATELAEYLLHNNDPADAGYRRHLAKLIDRVVPLLPSGARGLDFGSGPGPTISVMLGEQGWGVTNFDPFFAPDTPDQMALSPTYDFITCTETAEHFFAPAKEFELLARLIKPSGTIGIMTRLRERETDFSNWYYIRETSHVTFYAASTMSWIAQHFGWSVEIFAPDVVIFRA